MTWLGGIAWGMGVGVVAHLVPKPGDRGEKKKKNSSDHQKSLGRGHGLDVCFVADLCDCHTEGDL